MQQSSDSLIFGKYEIIRRLAVGGMGEIFLSRQTGVAGFDRLVILKSLLPDLAELEGFIEQFLDEARVAATLNHPNIVAIYEVGLWEGTYFMAMEYIRGTNLATLLMESVRARAETPMPAAAHIIADAALGLDHAHRATDTQGRALNIIHRDISPHNIMVRDDGVTKVVDFGIAKASNRSSRTATGTLKGKLEYMSPEQLLGEPVSPRSDQWSLGVVAWELLTQKRLYKADSAVETIRQINARPPPKLREVVEGIPFELEEVVERMLRQDPEERYASCHDVASAMKSYLDTSSTEMAEVYVSRFVTRLVGERIDDETRDLTPSADENFVISLTGRSHQTGETMQVGGDTRPDRSAGPGRKRGRVIAVAGVVAALILAGLTVVLVRSTLRDQASSGTERPTVSAKDPPAETAAPRAVVAAAVAEPGTLVLTSEPSNATVLAGEQVIGRTPLRTTVLAPGTEHLLTLKHSTCLPVEINVMLEAGQTDEEHVELERKKVKRKPTRKVVSNEPGYLSIRTQPWTQVDIDGEPYGSTPMFKVRLRPGPHTVRLVNEKDGIREKRKVNVPPGRAVKLDLDLRK